MISTNANNIDAQVRSLEEELKAIKSLLELSTKKRKAQKNLASLRGIWKGKVCFSEKEIKEAETTVKGL